MNSINLLHITWLIDAHVSTEVLLEGSRGKIQSVIPLLQFLLRGMGQSWRASVDFVSASEWYYLIISFLSVIIFTSTASTWPGVFHPFHMQTHLDLRLIGNRSTVFEVDAGTKHLGTTGGSCDRWLICRRIMKVATVYIFIKYCIYVMRIYLYI